jgi:hypothetical protein
MGSHIPFPKGDAWLQATRSIWLATSGPNGRPHAAPIDPDRIMIWEYGVVATRTDFVPDGRAEVPANASDRSGFYTLAGEHHRPR